MSRIRQALTPREWKRLSWFASGLMAPAGFTQVVFPFDKYVAGFAPPHGEWR